MRKEIKGWCKNTKGLMLMGLLVAGMFSMVTAASPVEDTLVVFGIRIHEPFIPKVLTDSVSDCKVLPHIESPPQQQPYCIGCPCFGKHIHEPLECEGLPHPMGRRMHNPLVLQNDEALIRDLLE